MAKRIDHTIGYYYDSHPTREDLMGETSMHRALIEYLVQVLTWLFHGQRVAIFANLNFYQTINEKEYPLAPDIAIIKGIPFQAVRSWSVDITGQSPHVVFEAASEETWSKDLREKPARYAHMGVAEYFAYDPNERPLDRKTGRRLFGWQRDPVSRLMRPMPLRADGSLWSMHLQSALAPDNQYLRLYDAQGNLRLTEAEAEARRAEILAEKLRSLGIDPEQLF